MKPSLQKLWNAFPDHDAYPTMKDLYTWLGGTAEKAIDQPGFGANGNTCASRLSVAFNDGGSPITAEGVSAAHASTLRTKDKARIIFRVAEFRKYLLLTLGKPQVDDASPFDDKFMGKKGIVAFSVNWQNASGHIALWDGASYREPAHDNYASYVDPDNAKIKTSRGEFWELA